MLQGKVFEGMAVRLGLAVGSFRGLRFSKAEAIKKNNDNNNAPVFKSCFVYIAEYQSLYRCC